jgi:hypothetical protein
MTSLVLCFDYPLITSKFDPIFVEGKRHRNRKLGVKNLFSYITGPQTKIKYKSHDFVRQKEIHAFAQLGCHLSATLSVLTLILVTIF